MADLDAFQEARLSKFTEESIAAIQAECLSLREALAQKEGEVRRLREEVEKGDRYYHSVEHADGDTGEPPFDDCQHPACVLFRQRLDAALQPSAPCEHG